MSRSLTLLYGLVSFFLMCFVQSATCSMIAWLISLTFLGGWISDALASVIQPTELYKTGALIGFLRALHFRFSLPGSSEIQKAWTAVAR
ncbi:MAG TPA: hypothetical protein VLH56_01355 [Dissulfurispiraceae bacterium]|nr:hypothetical protein [Dissulfurispiraceae bacterium]